MNPAALKANLGDVPKGATLIIDTHDFTTRALARVGWASNPLEDGTLEGYNVHAVDLTQLTLDALEGTELSRKDAGRSKNMFALGLLSWMYSRPTEGTINFVRTKFANKPDIAEANITAFKAGWNFGETTEAFGVSTRSSRRRVPRGTYRNISGNLALAYGLIAAGAALGPAAVPGRVPDHAGVGHPARAVQAQALRHPHVPGRGRDRRHRRRARRGVRRRAGGDHVVRARASRSRARRSGWPSRSSCR